MDISPRLRNLRIYGVIALALLLDALLVLEFSLGTVRQMKYFLYTPFLRTGVLFLVVTPIHFMLNEEKKFDLEFFKNTILKLLMFITLLYALLLFIFSSFDMFNSDQVSCLAPIVLSAIYVIYYCTKSLLVYSVFNFRLASTVDNVIKLTLRNKLILASNAIISIIAVALCYNLKIHFLIDIAPPWLVAFHEFIILLTFIYISMHEHHQKNNSAMIS